MKEARPSTPFEAPPAWVRDAVFYQIFPDRFARSPHVTPPGPLEPWDTPPNFHGFKGGDLLGIAERLPELADLGVTALYLTPVFSSASNHRYHTDDYLQVDPLLGGNHALRTLLDALHARGMRLVLDGVFNHCGRGFWPFHHVAENGLASPYADWFVVDRERLRRGHGLQPYPDRPAHAEDRRHPGARGFKVTGYEAWWDLPALPKLNIAHGPVREYLLGVAEHWLRFGIDGWRLDVPFEIKDGAFWAEFRRRCRAVNPDAYLVGEVWQIDPTWLKGDRFDGLMNYPLQKAILSFVAGPSLNMEELQRHHELGRGLLETGAASFAKRLGTIHGAYASANVAAQLNLLSSHDVPRILTLLTGDKVAFRLATLLQMSLPGAPCVYYGDEIGMEGAADPDCRRAFPVGAAGRDEALRSTVRALAAARAAHPALRSDRVDVLAGLGDAIVLGRGGAGDATAGGESAIVAVNAGAGAATIAVASPALAGARYEPLAIPGLPAAEALAFDAGGAASIKLAPRAGAIWTRVA